MKSCVLFLSHSINLKVAHNEYQYKRYYLNCKSVGYKTCPIGIVMGYVFRKYFAWFEGLGCISRPFLIFPPTRINKKPIIVLDFLPFLRSALRQSKILNIIYWKTQKKTTKTTTTEKTDCIMLLFYQNHTFRIGNSCHQWHYFFD